MLPKSLVDATGGGVYYLHGEDEYRKLEAARALVDRYVDPGTRDFNFDRLNGSDTTVERLASVIATPPMMADWRVVHVKETEAFAASPKARAVLLEAAKKPPPGLALILQATVPARSRARFYKDMAKLAQSVEFKAVPPHEAPAWLATWAQEELGVVLELDAARALAGAAGTDLGVLVHEVRKLASMVGEGSPVDRAAVAAGGLRIPRQDRWEWFDLVAERRAPEAVRGLEILLEQGETPVGLVIGLSSMMLRIGVAVEGGAPALSKALPPYQRFLARRIAGQAQRWKSAEVARAVRGLRRLDQLLKASSISGGVLMEEWLWSVAAEPKQPGRGNGERTGRVG